MVKVGNICNAFFTLLRAGLWNEKPDDSCFPLQELAWKQLYLHARRQTVEGIIYDGMIRLPDEFLPPRALLMKWVALVDSLERRNRRMNAVIEELKAWFGDHGITAVLLKGQEVADCYEEPLHRVCGDIDWYIPYSRDYKRLIRLFSTKGLIWERQPGFSLCCQWKGIVVEFHKQMLDIHNPFVFRYLKKLGQSEKYRSPILSHLVVNSHILKHMMAFGIGIRQLCDSARICYAYHESEDKVRLEEVYRKVGMYRWVQLLNRLLVEELGLPEEYLPFSLSSDEGFYWMSQEVWESGNFGFYDERFGKQAEPWKKRRYVGRHLLHRFLLHVRYVPSEACWFPLMQAYSHVHLFFNR